VIERIWNPMPARGGSRPESLAHIRQRAPAAFRVQERAVTAKDYQDVVARARQGVQRSAATFRWTGSWRTVFLSADRLGGKPVDAKFSQELRDGVEPFRMAGMDLEVEAPRFVSLEITMHVCVKPAYFKEQVKEELADLFSSGRRADGSKGLFHPDRFTFGQPVHLSPLIAAAQAVAGVEFVRVTQFRRFGQPEVSGLSTGRLELERLEIARLDNDRTFPEHGLMRLRMEGGR
jgi:predicted phage baseplate assembly protein